MFLLAAVPAAHAATDNDGDGYDDSVDCNDNDASVFPGAYDWPNDGIDQNCDGADAHDGDGDGYANDNSWTSDCNDNDWNIHPGAFDAAYDGIDQDCDGQDTNIDWFTGDLYVSDSGASDGAQLGVRSYATTGFDAGLDAPQPPRGPDASWMEAYFSYPNNEAEKQNLTTSYVSGAPTMTWDLHLAWHAENTSCMGCAGTLQYNLPFSYIPAQFNVFLVDGSSITDLRQQAAADGCDYCYHSYVFDPNGAADGERDLQVVITTESVHHLWLNQGWSLVSMPVTLPDMSVAHVLPASVDSVLTWDGSQYVPVTTLEPGVGYFVHSTQWVDFQVFGTGVRSLDLTLHHGWNLVGSPIGYTPLWNLPAGVSQTDFYWTGGGYGSYSALFEGYGFWIYNDGSDVTVPVSTWAVHAPNGASKLIGAIAPAAPADAQFVLPFTATDGHGSDNATLLAVDGATDGYDSASDVMEPPTAAATQWTQASFRAGALQLDTSAVAPSQKGAYVLDVAHHGDEASSVTLTWSAKQLPKGYVFELVDGLTRVDLREASSYTFDVPAGASAKSFAVVVRAEDAPTCVASLDDQCVAQLPFDPRALVEGLLP